MSFETGKFVAFKSGEDMSGNKNRFVKYDPTDTTGGTMKKGVADGLEVGIQMNTPGSAVGSTLEVAKAGGGGKVVLAEAVVAGDLLKSDAAGAAVKAASGEKALAGASKDGAIGDVVPVVIDNTQKA